MGLAGILRTDYPNLSPEEAREIYDDLYFSGLRLHRTLRNYLEILDLQAESARDIPPAAPISAKEIEQSVQKGIKAATERYKRGEDVVCHLENCSLLARSNDVALIVEELVDNGCKFSRLGSPVTVSLDAGGVLSVTDAGRGMSPEEIEQIGAFQQFDRKVREQQGLGLGLILVKKLAAKSDAKFSIQSPVTDALGTSVRIAFPLAAA